MPLSAFEWALIVIGTSPVILIGGATLHGEAQATLQDGIEEGRLAAALDIAAREGCSHYSL